MAFIKLIREDTRTAEQKQAKALSRTAKSTVDTNRQISKDLRIQRRKRSDSHRRQQTRRTSARTKDVNNRLTQLRKATLQGSTKRRRTDENRTWKTEGTITLNEFIGAALSTLGGAIAGGAKGIYKVGKAGVEIATGGTRTGIRQGTSTLGAVANAPRNVLTGKTPAERAKAKAAKEAAVQKATTAQGGQARV
jgi:hypothetical protein